MSCMPILFFLDPVLANLNSVVRKEARWSDHNFYTSVNVCMNEIIIKKMYLRRNGYLYECVYVSCVSLYRYVCVHCIQSICAYPIV